MKKSIFLFLLTIISYSIMAQDKYTQIMSEQIAIYDTTHNKATLQSLANKFNQISERAVDKWQPLYYAALCNVDLVYYSKKDEIELLCDKASDLAAKAWLLKPDTSEMEVLDSKIAGARIMINPMTNGSKYGSIATSHIQKAIAADSTNPRIYLTMGISKYYTPKMFGGSKSEAKTLFDKAQSMYAIFKPSEPLNPNWGLGTVMYFLSQYDKK